MVFRGVEGGSAMEERIRRARYDALRRTMPQVFGNPPGAPIELLLDPAEVRSAEEAVAADLVAAGRPAAWAETGVVFEDQYLLVLRDAVRWPSGRFGTYLRTLDVADAAGVVVLPRLGDDVVLVRHFRHSTRSWHYEVPRGFGSPGSTPEEDARRELAEEIGVLPRSLDHLGIVYPDTGMMAGAVHLFHAAVDGVGAVDTEEGIDAVKIVSPDELGRMIRDHEVDDGFTMAAYLRALLLRVL